MNSTGRTFLLHKIRAASECGVCGDVFPAGSDMAILSGARHATSGKPLGDVKMCGICSSLFMPKPDNWDSFFDPPSAPTPRECLELVDSGVCDSSCLLAKDDAEECGCRCRGEYHGYLRLAIATLQITDEERPRHSLDDDVAVIASMDPPPRTVREARQRLNWRNARSVSAMRAWRDATEGHATREDEATEPATPEQIAAALAKAKGGAK